MSGGSFNYLCHALDLDDLVAKQHDLADMAEFLAARGYGRDAAQETAALLAKLRQVDIWAEVTIKRLAPVWKAAEWWQSCDSDEDGLRLAIAEYRGLTLPDCERCGGTGKEPGELYQSCSAEFCAQGRDVSSIAREDR
jgi:hypothetical protein